MRNFLRVLILVAASIHAMGQSYFPEGTTPQPGDTPERSAQKINQLLFNGGGTGGGTGGLTYFPEGTTPKPGDTLQRSLQKINQLELNAAGSTGGGTGQTNWLDTGGTNSYLKGNFTANGGVVTNFLQLLNVTGGTYARFDANGNLTNSVRLTSVGASNVSVIGTLVSDSLAPTNYINLAALTASRVLVSDASKNITNSATTATEIGYSSGVTSAIQTQLNSKATVNGVANTVTSSTGTSQRVAIFDSSLTNLINGPILAGALTNSLNQGSVSWSTGLGAFNQVQGPSDQALSIVATAPVQASASVAGNALNITAANATAGSSSAGAAAGGAITITAGNATRLTSGNSSGGSISNVAGNGVGNGVGGSYSITGGVGGSAGGGNGGAVTIASGTTANSVIGTPVISGSITISTPNAPGINQGSGSITISTGNGTGSSDQLAPAGDIALIAGNSGSVNVNGNRSRGGNVSLTSGTAGSSTDTSSSGSSAGGNFAIVVGSGMANSANTATAGNGGLFSITGGAGGVASGTTTAVGGAGSAITVTTGAGGNATGASGSRTGGASGTLTLATGAAGTGATANGAVGSVVISPGGTTVGTFNTTSLVLAGGAGVASTPVLDMSQTWNTGGTTYSGIKLTVTYSAAAAGSKLIDLLLAGTTRFSADLSGNVVAAGNLTLGGNANSIKWTSSSELYPQSDGVVTLFNNARSGFGRIQIGGSTSSFPSIKQNGAGIDIRLADDSGYALLVSAGTTAAGNAAAGTLGEVVSSLVASGSPVSLTTATGANVTSISLTAGDWDVEGNINFAATTATVTGTSGGITSTSATVPTDGSEVFSGVQVTVLSETDSVTLPRKRINVNSTTTVYLVGKCTFSAGTVAAFGSINARRVR